MPESWLKTKRKLGGQGGANAPPSVPWQDLVVGDKRLKDLRGFVFYAWGPS